MTTPTEAAMRDAREVIARGHCRANCWSLGADKNCEHMCMATESGLTHGGHYKGADAILAALSSAGMAVVPVEPTQEMVAEMRDAWDYFDANDDVFRREYRAAIAAALPPLASGGG